MDTRPVVPVRRRVALAFAAGGLVLVGGAGVAYAAGSTDTVETGWATVSDSDPKQDCPEGSAGSDDSASSEGGL